ncbi:MAG: sugar phosphate isomerase/epimerase family protein [Planctomycetota bacterium]
MTERTIDRRKFIEGAIGAAAAAGLGGCQDPHAHRVTQSAGSGHPIRLGAKVFTKTQDPEQLAIAHRQMGYRAAYYPQVELHETDRIRAFSKAYAKHDVVIAEVGAWSNLLDPDPKKRSQSLQKNIVRLALAEAIGALCCVNIAGSYSTELWYGPHPDNISPKFFDASVENARKIIDAVKPQRTKYCFEMMSWAIPDCPHSYLKLMKAVDRKAFAVHLDPCNLINSPRKFYNNTALLNECFDKLGPYIASCHAKDLTWDVEPSLHFREVPAGSGKIDYKTYLQRLAKLPHNPPLMIEHCKDQQEYKQAANHILNLGPKVGVSFG